MCSAKNPLEIRVSVVGAEGVGKKTLIREIGAKLRSSNVQAFSFMNYILHAYGVPSPTLPVKHLRIVLQDVDKQRLLKQSFLNIFRDEIVILVYDVKDMTTYDYAYYMGKFIKLLLPNAALIFVGNRNHLPCPNVFRCDNEIYTRYHDQGFADKVKLQVCTNNFKQPEFIDKFIAHFFRIVYSKSCADRAVMVEDPDSSKVTLQKPFFLCCMQRAVQCSIL